MNHGALSPLERNEKSNAERERGRERALMKNGPTIMLISAGSRMKVCQKTWECPDSSAHFFFCFKWAWCSELWSLKNEGVCHVGSPTSPQSCWRCFSDWLPSPPNEGAAQFCLCHALVLSSKRNFIPFTLKLAWKFFLQPRSNYSPVAVPKAGWAKTALLKEIGANIDHRKHTTVSWSNRSQPPVWMKMGWEQTAVLLSFNGGTRTHFDTHTSISIRDTIKVLYSSSSHL